LISYDYFYIVVIRARQLSILDSDKINTFVKVEKKNFVLKKIEIILILF
jgi:hypothetical protein